MRPQSDSKICGNVHPACLDTRYEVCFFNILTKSSNSVCEFSLSTLLSQLELCILILTVKRVVIYYPPRCFSCILRSLIWNMKI
ncbi:hypothetical protein HanPI659440_Chr12g0466711 [Helianthus annuus]|nr:hypothetical protein HanPI659440_Chr12g0466711 [Helianthus annuus]